MTAKKILSLLFVGFLLVLFQKALNPLPIPSTRLVAMKEIKSYLWSSCLDKTIAALQDKGAPGITIVTLHPVGYGFGKRFSMSKQDASKKYYDISKIEMVCDAKDLETFLEQESARNSSSLA